MRLSSLKECEGGKREREKKDSSFCQPSGKVAAAAHMNETTPIDRLRGEKLIPPVVVLYSLGCMIQWEIPSIFNPI